MRSSVLIALLLGSLASLASAEERLVVAAAGECAGEERELAARVLPKSSATVASATTVLLLSPSDVAAASPALAAAELPSPPSFSGPGACDNPGSGCVPDKVLDDPDPGTGCGFPGSPCP